MPSEWPIETKYAPAKKFEKFSEKYRREYESLFSNLERILFILRSGSKLGSFQVGFFRSEGDGVYRIGQSRVVHAKESRLYVFPNTDNDMMYILTIGTKDRQDEDIIEAKQLVMTIRQALEEEKTKNQPGV